MELEGMPIQQKFDHWLEKGKELIYPEKLKKWNDAIITRLKDMFHGAEITAALEVMEVLENGTIKQGISKLLEQGHDSLFWIVVALVTNFSKKGPEFHRELKKELGKEIEPDVEKALQKIEKENKEYELNNRKPQ